MQTEAILLVDDNPDDVTLTLRAFKKNNIKNKIIVANDGLAALDLLLPPDDATPLRPAIVLLDLNMPRMNGLEVLRRMRSDTLTQLLPVIVLTTSNEDRDIAESYRFGANSFVRKPVTFQEFLEAAKILGLYWLSINQQVSLHPSLAKRTHHARRLPTPGSSSDP
jgi:two-component system response regulator